MRKKILGLILILLMLTITSYSQSLPNKKEQYDFLKWFLKAKQLAPLQNTSSQFIDIGEQGVSENLNDILISLPKSDRRFILRQIKLSNNPVAIDTSELKGIHFREDTIRSNYIGSPYNYVSWPIFTTNRKLVLINWGYYCGITCGHQEIEAYIKNKYGKWKRYNKLKFPYIAF